MNIKCPKCGSENCVANKKGFGAGKAAAGYVVAGPLGLAAGAIGGSKVRITCLDCGYTYKAGEYKKELEEFELRKKMEEFPHKPAPLKEWVTSFMSIGIIAALIGFIFDLEYFKIPGVLFASLAAILFVISLFKKKK